MEWCPYDSEIFLSCSEDNKVNVWHLGKIGDETKQDENTDGPQELVFTHRGHLNQLSDASWHLTPHSMYLASVDNENNHLAVWQMASNILEEEYVL